MANFATLTEEIEVVQGSKDLDKDVAVATEQRNEENEEFTKTMAADTAAEEPLQSAMLLMLVLVLVLVTLFVINWFTYLFMPPPKRDWSGKDVSR